MDRWEKMLDQDWSETWDTLPKAPDLVPRAKTAQVTLRLPVSLVDRIKRVATTTALPYHSLARSWIIEALRQPDAPVPQASDAAPQTAQLNLKLDNSTLDELKARASELRIPYHRLAREWIQLAVTQAEASLDLPSPQRLPAIKDLIVLLLHSPNKHGNSAIRGVTRLQKLLFVVQKQMSLKSDFYAFNYGPFNEDVNDAAHSLELAGFLQGPKAKTASPPSFDQMMATVAERAGSNEEQKVKVFELSDKGHEAAETLRQSDESFSQLFEAVHQIREEWDTPDLIERVYEAWPEYAEKSVIREEVDRRRKGRRSQ